MLARQSGVYVSSEITIVISLSEYRDTEQAVLAMCEIERAKNEREPLSEYRDTEQAVLAMCEIERAKNEREPLSEYRDTDA